MLLRSQQPENVFAVGWSKTWSTNCTCMIDSDWLMVIELKSFFSRIGRLSIL